MQHNGRNYTHAKGYQPNPVVMTVGQVHRVISQFKHCTLALGLYISAGKVITEKHHKALLSDLLRLKAGVKRGPGHCLKVAQLTNLYSFIAANGARDYGNANRSQNETEAAEVL